MREIYITPGEVPNDAACGTTLPVARSGTQEQIGTASFLLDVWCPQYGVCGLYELFLEGRSVGAFALFPDATFCAYEQLAEEAKLPPEPQHAMLAALRADECTRHRELACLVYHAAAGGTPAGFRFFLKRAEWQIGHYESTLATTVMDAFHLYQKERSHTLLLPYRVGQPILAYVGAR